MKKENINTFMLSIILVLVGLIGGYVIDISNDLKSFREEQIINTQYRLNHQKETQFWVDKIEKLDKK